MKTCPEDPRGPEFRYHMVGWCLFVLCALFFIASSVKNGDVLTLIGSVIFLIACLLFILPMVKKHHNAYNKSKKPVLGDSRHEPE